MLIDDEQHALALVMLSELPGVGERGAARVLGLARRRRLPLTAALRLPPDQLAASCRLPPRACAFLQARYDRLHAHAADLLSQLRITGVTVCDDADDAYPARWRAWADPRPPLVFTLGTPARDAGPTLSILSSRDLTAAGVSATLRIVQSAAAEGFVLVTGGMKSNHRVAAVAARATGAPRLIVLDRGLFAAFGCDLARDPFGFGPGRAQLDSGRTVAFSTFRLGDHAAPRNGRRRDHLLTALGDLVVAVRARAGGEIERTCLGAADRGQSVVCWQDESPGLLAAGVVTIDDRDVRAGLRRFLAAPRT
jgi:predicted Rossmann fold nucleotide-binding protein DprA/Smf involved in DNA uptake